MQQCSFENIPDSFLKKWQEIADLLANIIQVPAALIMKVENETMEVFSASKTENNPYNIGDKEHWHGLYCETVIKTQKKLNIPNALKDKDWDKNPDLKLGMLAYLGFPINFPDKTPFGTLCVLDSEERQFTAEQDKILLQFKNTIELDLALICTLELEKNSDQSDIINNLLHNNEEYQVINEEYLTTNEELQQTNDELQQAKQRAEENEEKYRRIADNVTDVVWITDLEMNPTYISPSVERVYGITPEEYLKHPITRTYPPASIEKFKQTLAEQFAKEQDPKADKNRTFQLEVERYYADGTLGWDAINATFIRDAQKNPIAIQGVSHDITERKQAEEKLQESVRRFDELVAKIPVGVYAVWLKQDGQMKFDYISDRWCAIHKLKREDVMADAAIVNNQVHPDEREAFLAKNLDAARGQKSFVWEGRFIVGKGELRWLRIESSPAAFNNDNIRWFGVTQDITERKQAEKSLQEKNDLLEKVFDSNFDLVALTDLEGNFTMVGKSHEILGYDRDFLSGKNVMDFVHPEDVAHVSKEFTQFLKSGNDRMVEYRNRCSDGTYLWFETIGTILKDEKGNPEQILFNTRNITERKKAEDALRESETRFQKMLSVVPDMISIQNPEMDILYSNWQGFAAVPKSKQFLNTKCYKTYRNFDDTCPDCLAKTVLKTRKPVHEERQLPDGTWYDIRVIPILDENNNVEMFMEWVRDITESKQTEETLRLNYALLQIAGETARFGGWSVDLEKNTATWSDAVADIHEVPQGFAPPVEEAINFYAPEWREKITQVFGDCAQKGIPYDEEMEIITAKGKRVWVRANGRAVRDENGKIIKVQGSFQDITEYKQAEEALRESERKMRSIYSVAPTGIGVVVNRVLKDVNPRVCDMTGYAREELIEKNARILYPTQEDYEFVGKEKYKQIRAKGTGEVETRWQQKNGTIINLLMASTPIDKKDLSKGVAFTALDITDRKQAEEALKDSTKKLQHWHELLTYIIKHNRSAVAVHDIDLNYIYVSQRYMDIFNVKDPDIIGKHHYEVFPDLPQKWRDVHQKALQGEVQSAEEDPFYRADGIVEWTRWECRPWYEADGSIGGIIVYTEVITERKQREQILTEQKDLLSAIYRNAPMVMMVVNSERRVQQVNGFATQFAGKDAEDMLGLRGGEALRCMHVLDDPKGCGFGEFCRQCVIRNTVLDTLETGETHLQEEAPYFFKGEDDKIKEMTFLTSTTAIQVKGERMVLVTLQDITDRKQAEEALKESEKRFHHVLRDIPWIAVQGYQFDGTVIYWNKASENLYGYTADEAFGSKLYELIIPPEMRENVRDEMQQMHETLKPAPSAELSLMRKNGSRVSVISSHAIIQRKGHAPELFCLDVDITDRKRAEKLLQERNEKIRAQNEEYESINEELRQINEELIEAKEKAEQSDRLKTAFLQNMSHEIRTPLNAISGFSGMLNKPKLQDEKRKKFVSIIQNSSQQLVAIISDILTISSLDTEQEKVNIAEVDINRVMEELFSIFKPEARKQDIALKTKKPLSDGQSVIYTDKTKITQIFTNLLSNALKFTHEGFVEMGYTVKTDNEIAEMEFYVKDSGIGMTSDQQKIIFERFQQAHKSINKLYGGTGLGLSISRGFAEMLGGKIWLESAPNEGSTFYFTIPYKSVNKIDTATSHIAQNVSSGTILVAEDEELNFILIEEYLNSLDVKLIHAKDGQETLDICKSKQQIDLVLMDIKMPKMTGDEAAKIIKKLKPGLPIVAQSAYVQEHDIERFSDIFDAYLAKPITEDVLKQIVNKFINISKE